MKAPKLSPAPKLKNYRVWVECYAHVLVENVSSELEAKNLVYKRINNRPLPVDEVSGVVEVKRKSDLRNSRKWDVHLPDYAPLK